MNLFIEKSNFIEIHCWNEEKEIIEEIITEIGDSFEIKDVESNKNMTIFKGTLTKQIQVFLLSINYLTKNKELKWFSVFLNDFSSEHWGTEYSASNISDEDIIIIKSIMPENTRYYQYDSQDFLL